MTRKRLFRAAALLLLLIAIGIPLQGIWFMATERDTMKVTATLISSRKELNKGHMTGDSAATKSYYVCTWSYSADGLNYTYSTTQRTQPSQTKTLDVYSSYPHDVAVPHRGLTILLTSPIASGLALFGAWKCREKALYG